MAEIAGQIDIFDSLDEQLPVPPFTVYICVWAEKGCGWCHSSGLDGGGACRNPRNKDESLFYSYCGKCRGKYGYPKPGHPDYPVTIDRTQKARPGAAPNLQPN
jgi:hypothetical protein